MSSSGGGGGGGAASASASFEQHTKRRPPSSGPSSSSQQRKLRLKLSVNDDDEDAVAADVVPPVTVVLDGRCICHRVHLDRHTGYRSLAGALRRMFVGGTDDEEEQGEDDGGLDDIANAIPGHVVAYEDVEDDLLLAGDLKWNVFVRVAKRIRIIPVKKSSSTKKCGGGGLDN